MDEITIRTPETPGDYRALARRPVTSRRWGIGDDTYILPVSTMVSVHHHGGFVVGAYRPDGEAVGLSFGFLGRIVGRICLHSQLTGVVPECQSTGLGSRMKAAQREFCLAEGIELIAWAFDPFRAANARFNLNRLGATCGRYLEDMYGPRSDALNLGSPTDRLIAEWEVRAALGPPRRTRRFSQPRT